jgi:hypothetical protein
MVLPTAERGSIFYFFYDFPYMYMYMYMYTNAAVLKQRLLHVVVTKVRIVNFLPRGAPPIVGSTTFPVAAR